MFAKVIVSIGIILENQLIRRIYMTAYPLIFLVYDKIQFKIAKNNNAKISIWLISTHMLIDVLYLLNIPTVHTYN